MEYFLGIDIGTTAVKTIAFSDKGDVLNESTISYSILHPLPEWSEQDPEEIAAAVFTSLENILRDRSPDIPRSCCFSSAMHSLIAVDKTGKAISPCIIWADNRASDFANRIHNANQAVGFYSLTGVPVHAMSPFCKILWIKEHQPDVFKRSFKFVGIKEYIFFKLFGIFSIDASIASATGLMNLKMVQWDPWILEQTGITEKKLSEIVPVSKIFSSPRIFPTLKNTDFIIGGSDGAMANVGSSDEAGALVITIGTSSAARLIVDKPYIDSGMRCFCYHLEKQSFLVGGASNNGGIVLQWMKQEFFKSNENVSRFLDQASEVKPGSDGLFFLPYLLGERAPVWNANARGILFGLHINHGQAEMVRAAMEGVIYCLYSISQPLFEITEIRKIYATGGFARNPLWLQMLADVFNLPVLVSSSIENSAWGAAKTGMKAINISVPKGSSISQTYYPDFKAHKEYAVFFQKFQRIYELVKGEFI